MMRRFLLPTIALLGVILVLLVPQTSWLARVQVKMAWFGQGKEEVKLRTTPPEPIATTPAMEAVWRLNTLCTEKLEWLRADLHKLVTGYSWDDTPMNPTVAAEALKLCSIGEQTDPENAFFPLMRGSVLFGLHRDSEALEVLHLATEKSRFDTYESDATRSVYQQLQARGNQGITGYTLPLQDVWDAQKMWPSMLGGAYQGMVAHALRRQSIGDLKGAMALRQDLRRLYDFLIQKEPYAAPRIEIIAQLNPGGLRAGMGPTLPIEQRPDRYIAFLREQGYASEAIAFERSYAVSRAQEAEFKANLVRGDKKAEAISLVYGLCNWGWTGLILLASVIATLGSGMLARMLLFTQGVEVSRKGRIGALLTFLILVPLMGSVCYGPAEETLSAWIVETMRPAGRDQGGWLLASYWNNMQALVGLLAPVFLAQFIGVIWALVKRRPLGQGILGGVWRASIPVASVTLMIWCSGIVWLAQEEVSHLARFSEALQQ
ncbi:MAG: hypothetical protein QM758_02345 [Armatimonas sp.]